MGGGPPERTGRYIRVTFMQGRTIRSAYYTTGLVIIAGAVCFNLRISYLPFILTSRVWGRLSHLQRSPLSHVETVNESRKFSCKFIYIYSRIHWFNKYRHRYRKYIYMNTLPYRYKQSETKRIKNVRPLCVLQRIRKHILTKYAITILKK